MMIVPRSFSGSNISRNSIDLNEKNGPSDTRSRSRSPSAHSPSPASRSPSRQTSNLRRESRSDPVRIPSRPSKVQANNSQPQPSSLQPKTERQLPAPKVRRDSAKEILTSTAIPLRRKPRGRLSQRLPQGDHVAEFSKLLWGEFSLPSNGNLSRSASSSNLDGLFGNMDELLEERQMFLGSEGVDAGVLTTRSLSNASLPSMVSHEELSTSLNTSPLSSLARSPSERKLRQIASSEDCSQDHPLSLLREEDIFGSLPELNISPPATSKQSMRGGNPPRSSFKSSLTASLKAIKSAAQSVSSNLSNSTKSTENVLAHSFFDIQPSLTDDRRPPPSPTSEPPPAEMRRYLNPPPLESAAQLHFWQDHRHINLTPPPTEPQRKHRTSKKRSPLKPLPPKSANPLPAVVPLATCLPPSIRTANASSPPIWLAPDGTPSNKHTATPLLYDPDAFNKIAESGATGITGWRNREPRENRDFLRVYVCEMEMRRNGKLNEDLSSGRARLWLPPIDDRPQVVGDQDVKGTNGVTENGRRKRREGRERLKSWTVEDDL